MRIIEQVRAEMKVISVITTGRIAGRRDCDTFVGRNIGASELGNNPTVGDLVVKCYRITISRCLTQTTEATPQRRNAGRPELRRARGLIKDLVTLIDDLNVL